MREDQREWQLLPMSYGGIGTSKLVFQNVTSIQDFFYVVNNHIVNFIMHNCNLGVQAFESSG